jgi:hypothetical protein
MSDSWLKPFEEGLPSETIISAVTAYRIWYVPIERLELHSRWIHTLWLPCARLVAECHNHMSCVCSGDFWLSTQREPEGDFVCSCSAGIYAWKTFDQAFEMYMDEVEQMRGMDSEEPAVNRLAFGRVYLWGKVIECEKGFRGQYAYPAGIYYTAGNSPSLADIYRIPLLAIKDHSHGSGGMECP